MTLAMELTPFGHVPDKKDDVDVGIDEVVEENFQIAVSKDIHDEVDNLKVITPSQIELLLAMLQDKVHKNIFESVITKAIQDSYNEGYNDFKINTYEFDLHVLCGGLKGKNKNPINVNIIGDVGMFFGFKSKYCNFTIYGDVAGFCGTKSENSYYKINGNSRGNLGSSSRSCIFRVLYDASLQCGNRSQNSYYMIEGNVDSQLGEGSKNCYFYIKGDAGPNIAWESKGSNYFVEGEIARGISRNYLFWRKTKGCIIKNQDRETVQYLKKRLRGNKIIHVK